jgi:3-keto-disaccharide hydrolase
MRLIVSIGALLAAAIFPTAASQQNPYLGAWNLTGTGQDSSYVYWLEIKDAGGTLSGMFLNRTSSPVPLAVVKIDNGELVFQGGQPGKPTGPEYRAKIEGGKLIGHHTVSQRAPGADASTAPTPRTVNWIGVRPPAWPAANANGNHTYGTPVVLFDGKSLDGFVGQNANRPLGWAVVDGVATNTPPANNLVSKEKFTDFKIEAEYKLAPKGNSGIYLRGRYELQLYDDLTGDPNTRPEHKHMAIYGRTPTMAEASKPAGEWQRMEAVIVGNRVTVTLNGTRVHDNAVILGITGGALDNDELTPGPILIQGDHEQVWVRKVIVTPITAAGK